MEVKDIEKRLGFLKQPVDKRDRLFMPLHTEPTLPPHVDLRSLCPPVLDQGNVGSCTANAISSVVRFALRKQKARDFQPSRLFIYYNERAMQGWQNDDSGAYIRDGFKSINTDGVCSERSWKYEIERFKEKPPERAYKKAAEHQSVEYKAVEQNLTALKGCIADGFPCVFGFTVFESFKRIGKDGLMPYPAAHEAELGGHAIYACGYDDATERFICANSWGVGFGDKGYFYMSYLFITNTNFCDDFWSVRIMEQQQKDNTKERIKIK